MWDYEYVESDVRKKNGNELENNSFSLSKWPKLRYYEEW